MREERIGFRRAVLVPMKQMHGYLLPSSLVRGFCVTEYIWNLFTVVSFRFRAITINRKAFSLSSNWAGKCSSHSVRSKS